MLLACHITSYYSEKVGIIWKMKTSLYSPTQPSKLLYPTLWVLLCISLFSYAFVLLPFLLYSKYPSESQCHRDPGPQRPLEKMKTKMNYQQYWQQDSLWTRLAPICSVTKAFPPWWLWYHHSRIWVQVGPSSETWTLGKQRICCYANCFRHWKRGNEKISKHRLHNATWLLK